MGELTVVDDEAYPFALAGLPHTDLTQVFADLGAIRNGGSGDILQIECRFLTMRGRDFRGREQITYDTMWLPLTDLPFLVPDMRYVRRRPAGIITRRDRRRLVGFRPREICDLIDDGEVVRQVNLGPANETALTVPRADRPHLLDRSQGVLLSTSEMFRFYFGGVSGLSARLLSAYEIDAHEAGVLDPERTFFDVETKTFHIAPTWEFSDQGSALQLATILASPDLNRAWRAARQGLMANRFAGRKAYPICWFDEHPPVLSVAGLNARFSDATGRIQSAYRVNRIISDFRPPPFNEIVVHLSRSETRAPEDDAMVELLQRGAKWKDLTLNSQIAPGGRTIRSSGSAANILKAFPNFDDVLVRYEFGSPPVARRQISPERPAYTTASTAERATGEPDVARIVARPTRGAATRTTRIGDELLFVDLDFEKPILAPVSIGDLSYPLRQFVNASVELSRRGSGQLIDPQPYTDEAVIWRLPESWPRWEHHRHGHPMFAAVATVRIGEAMGLAIELGRHRPTAGTSIGIFSSPFGFPLGPMHAAIILRHAVSKRSALGDWDRGYWPTESRFADVTHRPVRHLKQRRSAAILADTISDAVESLTQPG